MTIIMVAMMAMVTMVFPMLLMLVVSRVVVMMIVMVVVAVVALVPFMALLLLLLLQVFLHLEMFSSHCFCFLLYRCSLPVSFVSFVSPATCIIALTPLHIFPTASASVSPILSLEKKRGFGIKTILPKKIFGQPQPLPERKVVGKIIGKAFKSLSSWKNHL